MCRIAAAQPLEGILRRGHTGLALGIAQQCEGLIDQGLGGGHVLHGSGLVEFRLRTARHPGGGIEAVVCSLTISRGVITPTINLDTPDPECDLDYVPKVARDAKVDVAMSNSFGFGGHNGSLVFARI